MSATSGNGSLTKVMLDDIAESIVDGPFGSNLKTSDYVDYGVPVLQGKNITGNKFVWEDIRYITEEKAAQLKRSSIVAGDHLLIKIGSIGYSAIVDDLHGHDFAIIPANLARLRPNRSIIDDRYLHRVLTSDFISRHFQSVASQTAQPALSLKKIKETPIPLPPLTEQKRIAGILDAADALRAKRRAALAELDALLQSTFLDLFGDPVTNPMGWEVVPLGDVANFHAGSTLPPGEDFNSQADGFLYLKVGDLNHPDNSTEIVRANLWGRSRQKGIVAPKNAVVIPKRGGAIGTNKKRVLTRPAVLDPNLMAISAGDRITHLFIFHWFHTFDLMTLTSGSSVPQLNKKDLAPLSIPLPPLGLQHRFSSIVESTERQKTRMRAHLAELDTLFASLQSRAFNGEL